MAIKTASMLDDPLVVTVTGYVKGYMANYDASHGFDHIQRVVGLAHHFYVAETEAAAATEGEGEGATAPAMDLRSITLAALLHDVGDRKYLRPGEDGSTMVFDLLAGFGAPEPLARRVQAICSGVSYTAEARDPAGAAALVASHPELAVVQDADRVDAIGAVGIGRVFTYGGARTRRPMQSSVDHFDEKLLRVAGMMKTAAGRRLAKERTERLLLFREWWREEAAVIGGPAAATGLE